MTRRPHLVPLLVLVLVAAAGALGAGCADGRECNVDADCVSRDCRPDGRCAPVTDGGGPADALLGDGAPARDGGGDGLPPDDAGGDGGPVSCLPDDDGVIARAEVPLRAGLHATFAVTESVTVDLAGTPQGSGRLWDLSGALTGDHALLNETRDLAGAWYASSFVGATYAARLSDTNELLGVFEVTDSALLLRGVVSPASGLTQTELTYDPPVTVLAFPLQSGATFTTTSTVTGQASGVWSAYAEKYDSQVDARGTLKTPYGTFSVLRVRTLMTRTVGLVQTTQRSFAFVTDCFGTVATVRSKDNETAVEFTQAAEVWRLSP